MIQTTELLTTLPEAFWQDVFTVPTDAQQSAYTNTSGKRGPYVYGWTDIARTDRFCEYAVDFKADYLSNATYHCLGQWNFDLSQLSKDYANVRTQYAGIGAYAGFQVLSSGEHVAILSIWNIYGEDADGRTHTFTARQVYPEVEQSETFGGEGTGVHSIVPYDWKQGHWYRMLIQCSTSDAGTTLVEQWVCDLETGFWTKLSAYDLGIANVTMMGPTCIFNENFNPRYAGGVRSLELRNMRIKDLDGSWRGIEGIRINCGQGALNKGYEGSYAFGALEDRFYIIATSSLEDEIANATGQREEHFTITNPESGQPYED